MQSELTETKSQLESERDALRAELSSVSSSRDAELSALRAELEGRVSDRESEIARVQSELAETKLSLESERDALQARLVELSSAQDEELTTKLAAQLSERESEIARVQSELAETKSQFESELDVRESKRILLQTEYDGLLHEVNNLRKSRDGAEKVVTQLESKISWLESQIDSRPPNAEFESAATESVKRDELHAKISQLQEELDDHARSKRENESMIAAKEREITHLHLKTSRLEDEVEQIKELLSADGNSRALNSIDVSNVHPDDEGAPGDGENPVQDTSNVSTNSDSIVETMKRDISRLERELAEALAELDSISYSFESASTVGATEFTQALNSARSEVTRLSNELEELEQRKQQALTESSERNESQLASLASAHAELEQSLREQLGAACESKERLEEELKSLASANAAAEEAKMVTERLNQSLREQLDVLSKERAELGERLLRREEELSAEGRTEKDVDESMSGMQTSSDTDDRDEVLELLRVEIVRLEQELAQALNVAQLDAADDVDELNRQIAEKDYQLQQFGSMIRQLEIDKLALQLQMEEKDRSTNVLEEKVRNLSEKLHGPSFNIDQTDNEDSSSQQGLEQELAEAVKDKHSVEQELERITHKLSQSEQQVTELEESLDLVLQTFNGETPDIAEATARIAQLESELEQSRLKEVKLMKELDQVLRETPDQAVEFQVPMDLIQWPTREVSALKYLRDAISNSKLKPEAIEWLEFAIKDVTDLDNQRMDAIDELETREREHSETTNSLHKNIIELETALEAQKTRAERAMTNISELHTTLNERNNDLESLRAKMESVVSNDVTRALESTIEELEQRLSEKDSALKDALASLNVSQQDEALARSVVITLEAEVKSRDDEILNARSEISRLSDELEQSNSSLETSLATVSEAESRIELMQRKRNESRRDLEAALASKEEQLRKTHTQLADQRRIEQELRAQLMKRPDDEGAPGDGENPVQDTSNVSTNSDSIVETMKRDISRLERELAEALAELDSISYSFESASTVGATEFTQALNSARSEVTRLSNELEELEQRKQQALTESSERNESQLASSRFGSC